MPNAVARVLTPLQIGVVLVLLGIGFLLLRHASPELETPMLVLGTVVLMPGIGFITQRRHHLGHWPPVWASCRQNPAAHGNFDSPYSSAKEQTVSRRGSESSERSSGPCPGNPPFRTCWQATRQTLACQPCPPRPMDNEAFAGFYERSARSLWAYLARVSGDPALADDLMQESYVRFLVRRTLRSMAK